MTQQLRKIIEIQKLANSGLRLANCTINLLRDIFFSEFL